MPSSRQKEMRVPFRAPLAPLLSQSDPASRPLSWLFYPMQLLGRFLFTPLPPLIYSSIILYPSESPSSYPPITWSFPNPNLFPWWLIGYSQLPFCSMLDFWEQNLYSAVLHTLPTTMLNTKQLLNNCCISPLMGNANQEVKHSICQMLVWTKYLLCSRSHATSILPAVPGCIDILLNIQSFKLLNLTVFNEVLSHLSFF